MIIKEYLNDILKKLNINYSNCNNIKFINKNIIKIKNYVIVINHYLSIKYKKIPKIIYLNYSNYSIYYCLITNKNKILLYNTNITV